MNLPINPELNEEFQAYLLDTYGRAPIPKDELDRIRHGFNAGIMCGLKVTSKAMTSENVSQAFVSKFHELSDTTFAHCIEVSTKEPITIPN